jgi:hypothetical protein
MQMQVRCSRNVSAMCWCHMSHVALLVCLKCIKSLQCDVFEVLTEATMKNTVSWDVTLCSPI